MKLIPAEVYAKDVEHSRLFLEGKSDLVTKGLTKLMEEASVKQDYEGAAKFRDQIIYDQYLSVSNRKGIAGYESNN